MPRTSNEELFDALVRHQTYLLRLSGTTRNKVIALLDATEADLAKRIRTKLEGVSDLTTPSSVRRLRALEKYVRTLRLKAWNQVTAAWVEDLMALADSEPQFLAATLNTVSPVVLQLAMPAPELLRAIVESRPFEGRTLRQWASSVAEADVRRITDQIKIGMVQGETGQQTARRIVGSARLRGTDGVTEITRRNAQAITRTAVNHVSNNVKREFAKANADILRGELYVATLDARTTPVCRANDGEVYPVGEGPLPPLHFNCRSLRVPALDGGPLGDRPANPTTQRMLLREYARKNGLSTPSSRADLPRGHKGEFDQFKIQRVRELVGTVPAKTTYQEWLSRQPKVFQEDTLGPTRAALFRKGGLKLDKFVNRQGDELTLAELASRHAEAFRAAGLDPSEFL